VAEFVPPRLDKLETQPEVQKLLLGHLKNQKTQTFLWTGPEGSGKRTHAFALVRFLFCQEGPNCAGCATCKQVLNRSHLDFFWVHREHFWSKDEKDRKKGEVITDVIRHLQEKLNRAPLSAPLKVAVIENAEKMNENAQDAFLKTLEEPPEKTLIILLAEKTSRFKPTVLSRCQRIRFPALSPTAVATALIRGQGWEKVKAQRAAQEAEGNLALALKFGDPVWVEFHDKVCADMDRALQGGDEEWLNLVVEYDRWEPDFLGDEELTANQRKAKVLTEVFQTYLGLWSRRLAGTAEVPTKLRSLPADVVMACLQKYQDMVATTYLSPKMLLDHLFLELRDGFQKGILPNRPFSEMAVQIQ